MLPIYTTKWFSDYQRSKFAGIPMRNVSHWVSYLNTWSLVDVIVCKSYGTSRSWSLAGGLMSLLGVGDFEGLLPQPTSSLLSVSNSVDDI